MAEVTNMSHDGKRLTNPELVTRLSELCQVDVDAVYAYEKAIAAIGDEDSQIRRTIEGFRDDHVEHVLNLSSVIWGLGGKPPTVSRDLKGIFLEGLTALQGLLGLKGALSAMSLNESISNKAYDAALSWEMPDGLRLLIEEHREDEHRHKEYIDSMNARFGFQSPASGEQAGPEHEEVAPELNANADLVEDQEPMQDPNANANDDSPTRRQPNV